MCIYSIKYIFKCILCLHSCLTMCVLSDPFHLRKGHAKGEPQVSHNANIPAPALLGVACARLAHEQP